MRVQDPIHLHCESPGSPLVRCHGRRQPRRGVWAGSQSTRGATSFTDDLAGSERGVDAFAILS